MMNDTVTPKRKGRKIRWVLGLSLALNLVFIGLFAGAAFRFGKDGGERFVGGPGYGAPLARSLPREERRILLRGLRSEAAGLPDRAARQELYRNMLRALRADPFDPAQVAEIFAVQGEVAQSVQAYAQETWLSLVTQMSEEERFDVAARLEEALRRPKRKDKRPKRD